MLFITYDSVCQECNTTAGCRLRVCISLVIVFPGKVFLTTGNAAENIAIDKWFENGYNFSVRYKNMYNLQNFARLNLLIFGSFKFGFRKPNFAILPKLGSLFLL